MLTIFIEQRQFPRVLSGEVKYLKQHSTNVSNEIQEKFEFVF